ncbi:MAG: hypothetical protein PHI08_06440 [Bacteroidales bacterium]|nr:hypothetical protein [Bacteroidales bacterium]
MKKLILIVALLIGLFPIASAQSKGPKQSVDFIANEKYFKVNLDYSQVIDKIFVSDEEIDFWSTGKPNQELLDTFIESLNDGIKDAGCFIRGSNKKPANYLLTIKVTNLDRRGNTQADLIFSSIDNDKVLYLEHLKGRGGHIGTLTNLMGDGLRNIAGKFGKSFGTKCRFLGRD